MLDKNNIPGHIAFIMDGNGRWAKERGLPRTDGHREGVKRADELIQASAEIGVKFVTFYAFSAENWKRPKYEIDILMRLLDVFLGRNILKMMKNNIRFRVIGRREPVPDYLWNKIEKAKEKTKNNTGLNAILAFNYGSRQEITDAARNLVKEALERKIKLEEINEDRLRASLYTADIPDPDLLIRTSGEQRLSNFLLWQLSYSELLFSSLYWPDFRRQNLEEAIAEYQKRSRRFGAWG